MFFYRLRTNSYIFDLNNRTLIQKSFYLFFLFAGIFLRHSAQATHLRAGEIIVKRIDCGALTFEITIIAYTDSGPADPVTFGNGELRFGDENDPNAFFPVPEVQNNQAVFWNNGNPTVSLINEDLGADVSKVTFSVRHTFGSSGRYVISYLEANRNAGILNIENGNSVDTPFFIETEIAIDGFLGCNNTPELLIAPIDRACTGVAFFHNPGAYDPDGDSLAFELVVPKKTVDTDVFNFIAPNDRSFYTNFNAGNENADGQPVFTINPVTGEIAWDAPGSIGEYSIAFIVKEYRFKSGAWNLLGFVRRDMQIIVEDCNNERPELTIPEDLCVEAGTLISEEITGTDPDGHDVKIEAFSQAIENLGAFTEPSVPDFSPSPARLTFNWPVDCQHIRDQPYSVVFKITDRPDRGPRLVSFETWQITVVAPRPELAAVEQEGQALRLTWDPYFCENAEEIEVWRRVDTNPYTPDECETGMRENAGYRLIATTAPEETTYRDTDLAAAAKYCYRLVASFPDVPGGESIVSDERCFEFVPAEQPVITHVSVEVTDDTDGEIVVAWREPFDLGMLAMPLTYVIYRATGSGTDGSFSNVGVVSSEATDSIGFRDTGLNTLDNAYTYQIAVVDPTGIGDGDEIVSADASSVRLDPTPLFGQIELNWSADVPWSNTIISPPQDAVHEIYKGLEGQSPDEFVRIPDVVDVSAFGFTYTDADNLQDEITYCYRVLTKGTYGNPAIKTPLLNYSQVACAQPSDSIPPCSPAISLAGRSCAELIAGGQCRFDEFSNELFWTTEQVGGCEDDDIAFFEVYYAPSEADPFEFVAKVKDSAFVHNELPSFKGCYQVRAIDRSGNEGAFSETFCVDNCPYYELPNVFTPGNADGCNDTFSAYGSESTGTDARCGSFENSKCARFVEKVELEVFNRWGRPVYRYTGIKGTENSILINWDGLSDDGTELSPGVYYYAAEVTFDVVDPAESVKQYKGWIHLLK